MSTQEQTTATTETTAPAATDTLAQVSTAANEAVQKVVQRVQEEASPLLDKAKGLIDRAEITYQDIRKTVTTKVEEQTDEARKAGENGLNDALSLLKQAQQEAETALQALKADFDAFRNALVELQNSSELKTYVQQLLSKLNSLLPATTAETKAEESAEAATPAATAPKAATRRKTAKADNQEAPAA